MTKEIKFKVSGVATTIMGGDTVDLGPDGVLVWLVKEDGAAYRLIHEKRVREINQTIEWVKRGK